MIFLSYLTGLLVLIPIFFLSLLPTTWARSCGAGLGLLLFKLLKYRRAICRKNLEWAFPELTPAAREKLLREHFKSIGMGLAEMAFAWFYPEKRLRRISRLEADPDSLAALRDGHCGVLLLSGHSTLLELGVRLLGLHVRANGTYRPIKNPFFDRWIRYQRERAAQGIPLINFKDMRRTLAVLREGGNIWYACDQDMGPKASVFVPFFNLETASIDVLPKLQARSGARLIPALMWREGDGYVVHIYKEIRGASAAEIMGQFNGLLETAIRAHPEQYYWLHRRFKSLPDGRRRDYGV